MGRRETRPRCARASASDGRNHLTLSPPRPLRASQDERSRAEGRGKKFGAKTAPVSQTVWQQDTSGGGWDVRARAHTCVALGRWVAFGRPNMSVWGHAGARSTERDAQSRMHFIIQTLFWYVQDAQWRPSTPQRTHICAARSRSRSQDAGPSPTARARPPRFHGPAPRSPLHRRSRTARRRVLKIHDPTRRGPTCGWSVPHLRSSRVRPVVSVA